MSLITLKSCRICLINHGSISIFGTHNNFPIAEIISNYTNVKINRDDGFLKTICKNCVEKVNILYSLKHEIESADVKMKSYFQEELISDKIVKFAAEENNESSEDEKKDKIDPTSVQFKELNTPIKTNMETTILKEYTCEICFKVFKRKAVLNIHNKKHKDEILLPSDNKVQNKKRKKFILNKEILRSNEIDLMNISENKTEYVNPMENVKITYDNESSNKINVDQILNTIIIKNENTKELNELQGITTDSKIESDNTKTENDVKKTNKQKFKCELCDKEFIYSYLLKTHNLSHQDLKSFLCEICNTTFKLPSSLRRHRWKFHPTILKCRWCDQTFDRPLKLRNHLKEHPDKLYECDICSINFNIKRKFDNHMKTHNTKFICEICSKQFAFNYELLKHQRIQHIKLKPYKCDICDSSFTQNSSLTIHKRRHTGEKPYKCEICLKTFADMSSRRTHMEIHTGGKRHQCNICPLRFSFPSQLIVHQRKHTGETPFECEHCGKEFVRQRALNFHLRIHSGLRPYKCKICEKTFRLANGGLDRHMKQVHSSEKPHKCIFCDAKFKLKSNLNHHIKHDCNVNPNVLTNSQAGNRKKKKLNDQTNTLIELLETESPTYMGLMNNK